MRLVEVNLENCQRAIELAKKHLEQSDAPKYIKKIGKSISPVFLFDTKKKKYLGEAWAVSERCHDIVRLHYGIVASKFKTKRIKQRNYFLIITMFPNAFTAWGKTRRSYLNQVIFHEFSHLLDICARKQIAGNWSVASKDVDHDEHWQKISRWCGATKGAHASGTI